MLRTDPLAPAQARCLEEWFRRKLPEFETGSVWSDDDYPRFERQFACAELDRRAVIGIPRLSSYSIRCALKKAPMTDAGLALIEESLRTMVDSLESGLMDLSWTLEGTQGESQALGASSFFGERQSYHAFCNLPEASSSAERSPGHAAAVDRWKALPSRGDWKEIENPGIVPNCMEIETRDAQRLCEAILQLMMQLQGGKMKRAEVAYGLSWPVFLQACEQRGRVLDLESEGPRQFAEECQRHHERVANRFPLRGKARVEVDTHSRIALFDEIVAGRLDLGRSVLEGIKLEAPLATFLSASRRRRISRKLDAHGKITYVVGGQAPAELVKLLDGSPAAFS